MWSLLLRLLTRLDIFTVLRFGDFCAQCSVLTVSPTFGNEEISNLANSSGCGVLFKVATLFLPTCRINIYLQPLLYSTETNRIQLISHTITITKPYSNINKVKFSNYLFSYFVHKSLALLHFWSEHFKWHMHFVANIFDSSHGICNATRSFGKLW